VNPTGSACRTAWKLLISPTACVAAVPVAVARMHPVAPSLPLLLLAVGTVICFLALPWQPMVLILLTRSWSLRAALSQTLERRDGPGSLAPCWAVFLAAGLLVICNRRWLLLMTSCPVASGRYRFLRHQRYLINLVSHGAELDPRALLSSGTT